MFDGETEVIYKVYAKLHEALIPYLMTQGGVAFAEARGLMNFQSKSTMAYLLGDDLFVVPVTDSSGTVEVEFPPGSWVFAFDETEVFAGSSSTTMTVPISSYPLFYREDSAVGSVVLSALMSLK
jgi:alpha-glucosidase (family GH31 glycosyl hydrolase)